ncbi:uncharacterized protein LOC17875691 isoform X2 [Capsella rubella]|nr:uncharacterized protein LOC17875691 isoform X2 [Capsella rubella]
MSELMMPFHIHPMTVKNLKRHACDLCFGRPKPGIVYFCKECELDLHKACIVQFLNNPAQCNHHLMVFNSMLDANGNERCHYCQQQLWFIFASCTICNIWIDAKCVQQPPARTIFQPKHHKHSLFLLGRLVTFTCNACGVEGDRNPYICIECNLMIHKDCIDLPRVITINRHEHRISHTFHLGQREGIWECGVCRKPIDWVYGAFKCFRCPSSYAVHSKCATRKEVWDGIELEDVPEEDEEIEDPFKV